MLPLKGERERVGRCHTRLTRLDAASLVSFAATVLCRKQLQNSRVPQSFSFAGALVQMVCQRHTTDGWCARPFGKQLRSRLAASRSSPGSPSCLAAASLLPHSLTPTPTVVAMMDFDDLDDKDLDVHGRPRQSSCMKPRSHGDSGRSKFSSNRARKEYVSSLVSPQRNG